MRPTFLIATAAFVSISLMLALGLVDPARVALLTGAEPPVPVTAATIELAALDGTPLTTASLRGEIVILEFWATWCGPCLAEIDDYNDLLADYEGRGVRVVGVTMESGDAAAVARFAREFGITYELAIGDQPTWAAFGPRWGFPQTVLIDDRWRVRRTWVGAGGGKIAALRVAIDDILAERTATVSVR